MATAQGPIVGRRRLRFALRQGREAAGLTQEQVASQMDWSLSKLIRIEAGTVSLSTIDLKALLNLYGITDSAAIGELVDLARASRQRTWWAGYKGRLAEHASTSLSYVGLEAETSSLKYFNALMIPGLLQTATYARALITAAVAVDLSDQEIDALVELRIARQREVLGRPNPPQVRVVLDEAALRRPIGGGSAMHEQLMQLAELGLQSNIDIRVLPFATGAYPAMYGPFMVFEFPAPADTPIVFLENAISGDALERPDEIEPYIRAFEEMWSSALSQTSTLALIERVANDHPPE
jgi:transcriptional regulator with XRE-family HTH domain